MNEENRYYLKFVSMIIVAMLVMYAITYLNSFQAAHIEWSETRLYMTLMMGASMAFVMLSFMWGMYTNRKWNFVILGASGLLFVSALYFVRSQSLVGDVSYMKAMIPHHSIAILTSERANIQDRRVEELAEKILEAQKVEIQEMQWLLNDIHQHGVAVTKAEQDARPVPKF